MKMKDGGDKFVRTTEDAYDIMLPLVFGSRQERFYVLLLGPRNRVIGEPREIAKGQRDCVAHNHPSGDPLPSENDLELTAKLLEAGRILNVQILDHVIIGVPSNGNSGFFSMAAAKVGGFN